MLIRSLVTLGAVLMASTALAQDITPLVDFTTDKANDLRGVAYGADGKIYVSGHKGDVEAETVIVVGRFNADGTPDTAFSEDGFAEVDLGAGLVEQSLAVAPLANGDVVAAVNAVEADGGTSIQLVRFDATGAQVKGDAWGGETGAVEVVFGWANANNDAFPGVEAPPTDTAWDLKVDNSSGTEKLVVAGHGSAAEGSGRTDADRFVTRLLASRWQRRSRLQWRQALHLSLGPGLRRRRPPRHPRGRWLDPERRLHQSGRRTAQPRHPHPPQCRWHARPGFRWLRHAAVLG